MNSPSPQAMTILVVEDDPGDFGLIRAHVQLAGLGRSGDQEPVIWAQTLSEGIVAANRNQLDVVLLDLSLPDSSGIATVRAMRAALPYVPIVVLTGHDDSWLAVAALEAGAQDYLVKGQFDADALRRAVRNALVRGALESRLRLFNETLEQRVQEELAKNREKDLLLLRQSHQSAKLASICRLAAGVAHEINNPIGFVNSNLGSLQSYMVDLFKVLSAYEHSEVEMTAETRAVLADLKQQVDLAYLREDVGKLLSESMEGLQRVKRIVEDLDDFSHVDGSERQWANLEQGLESTLRVMRNELKNKAEVVKEYGGIPEIECFPSQLNQVFMNLLINAAHAIEDHGRITLRTGQEGENVWVEVEDTGKGIKPEDLDRIFDPFFTTKPVGVGMGLGLSLSYGIVQQHGGRIEVKSEVGKGSVFRVVLPQHAVPVRSSATPMKDPN